MTNSALSKIPSDEKWRGIVTKVTSLCQSLWFPKKWIPAFQHWQKGSDNVNNNLKLWPLSDLQLWPVLCSLQLGVSIYMWDCTNVKVHFLWIWVLYSVHPAEEHFTAVLVIFCWTSYIVQWLKFLLAHP